MEEIERERLAGNWSAVFEMTSKLHSKWPTDAHLNMLMAESALGIDWQPRAPFDYTEELQDILSEFNKVRRHAALTR